MEHDAPEIKHPNVIARHSAAIQTLLVLLTLGAFAGVLFCGFVNYDDPAYVSANPYVLHGLNGTTIRWAVTHRVEGLYHPLTFLSLALDAQIFGVEPGGFHLDNLLLHCVGVLALYRLLVRMTGSNWRSAWVTAVWAVHPFRVESVAWITERKDMLMGLFGFLAIHAYVTYTRRPNLTHYGMVLLWLMLSLLSKPTFIVMPGLLLLLDIWPLQRISATTWRRLLLEKLPVFVCCVGALLIFAAGNQHFAAINRPPNRAGQMSLATRVAYGVTSYAWFALTTFRVSSLAAFYPIPVRIPLVSLIASTLGLVTVTALCVSQWKPRPWMAVGWGWFLITLLPTIGVLYPQSFIRADHFTYLPSIGLLVAMAWCVPSHWMRPRFARASVATGSGVLLVGLAIVSESTILFWRDSQTLWQHALSVTQENWVAETNYGAAMIEDGNFDAGLPHIIEALRINPGWSVAHYNYGNGLLISGDRAEALNEFRKASTLPPPDYAASIAAATLLMQDHDYDAAAQFLKPIQGQDSSAAPMLHRCYGFELLGQHQAAAAIGEFQKSVDAAPANADSRADLGLGLMAAGRYAAAVDAFEAALRLNPLSPTLPGQLRTAQATASTRPVR